MGHRIRIVMIFLLIILNCLTSFGQNISLYSLTTDEGLSHIKVNDVYTDEHGMIWAGTDYGLNRYDGHSVEVFLNNKEDQYSIPHNRITRITGDGNGHIWVICPLGLIELNLETYRFRNINKGSINSIFYDKASDRLYAGKGRKIYRQNDEKKFVEIADVGVPSHISDFVTVGDEIYAGTSGNGIWKVNQTNRSIVCLASSIKVTKMFLDSKSCIWAGSWQDGLCRIDQNDNVTTFRYEPKSANSLKSDFVRDCCEDSNGRIWIGTDIGLESFDPATNTFNHQYYSDYKQKTSPISIWCLTKDGQGNIWFGTYFNGLQWFNPDHEVYTWYKPSLVEGEGLSYPIIGNIVEDVKGNLYIATEGGGVNYLDRKTGRIKWLTQSSCGLTANNIQSLYYDKKTNLLWIGTHLGGLNCLDIRSGKARYCFPDNRTNFPVNQKIIKDIVPYKDSLVLATHNGVFMFDTVTQKYRRMLYDEDLKRSVSVITDVHIDKDENLWVSVINQGVLRHHLPTGQTTWFRHSGEGSISDMNIESMTEDVDGNMWFATTYSGIDVFNSETEQFTNFSSKDGILVSDHIFTLVHSARSNEFLMSTPAGFSTFDPVTKKSISYNRSNGFPLSDINDNSIYVTKDSTVFIGSIHGMVSFKEGSQNLSKKPYRITLSKLIVNGKEVRPYDETGILNTTMATTKQLVLESDASLFSIEVATSDYLSSDRCELQYKLERFSDEWHDLRRNTITYSNLIPGKYTLHIRPVHDSEEICSPISVELRILPPWYSTWWAIILWTLIGASVITLAIRFHYRSKQVQAIEEFNKSKLNFFTNISHEIRTPLTVIIAQIENLIYSKEFTPTVYNRILGIYKNSIHLKELISELLEFRKQEQGELKIKVAPHNIVKLVSEFYLVFEEYANTKQITMSLEKEINSLEVWYDATQLQKVFRNLLSNALKYTEPGGEVKLFLGMADNKMMFKISDTGCGISKEGQAHIFNKFYRIDRTESKGQEGTGIGLALVKGIIEQHGGTISVESTLGKGSTFIVTLPLGYSHFLPEQIEEENAKEQETTIDEVGNSLISAKGNKTMLIVDDNESIRGLLIDIFKPLYNILTASDGEEAWEIIQKELPDIIISDVLMPKMPGTELCRKIKQEVATCHIPVVLLTARVDIEHNVEGLLTGADDYIAKPFNTKLLISRCNNLVNSRIILQEKFSQKPETSTKILATNSIDKSIIDRATEIIEKNMDNPEFNVNVFAHEMAMSRTNLFTKIKAITGQTPNEFIMTLRLKKAAFMLKNNPELSIVEIADRTGFNSVKYFSKCFNDVYHIRPAAYRNNQEN